MVMWRTNTININNVVLCESIKKQQHIFLFSIKRPNPVILLWSILMQIQASALNSHRVPLISTDVTFHRAYNQIKVVKETEWKDTLKEDVPKGGVWLANNMKCWAGLLQVSRLSPN